MKKLLATLFILLSVLSHAGKTMITIPYTDSNISKVGRFLPDNGGIQSAWAGSQLRFKVQGTTQIILSAYCYDPLTDTNQGLLFGVNIDNGESALYQMTGDEETFTGTRTATITLPDTGLHTVIIKLADNLPWNAWDESTIIRFTQMQIDDGGEILPWLQAGNTNLMIIGDSWAAVYRDWPRLLPSQFSIYPVAYGGATAADLNSRYQYNKQGLAESDPDMDAVLVTPGVNDYNASVSGAAFQASILSLVDKIRSTQATAKIYLLQAPRNSGAGKNYDQYGTNLAAVAALRTNVEYIPTDAIWGSLTWVDSAHLDFASRQIYADFLAPILDILAPTTTATPPYTDGPFSGPIEVELTANDLEATIFYNTGDGTQADPTDASTVYSAPIEITATTTLKYFAKDGAGNSEAVKTAEYVINASTFQYQIKGSSGVIYPFHIKS